VLNISDDKLWTDIKLAVS